MFELIQEIEKQTPFLQTDVITGEEERRLKLLISQLNVGIKRIEKLRNPHLYAAFLLKKRELGSCTVLELIHSTAACNVESIKKNNLDWRMVQRAKYGYGVSFSKNADYANHHSSWAGGEERAFLICDVITKSSCLVRDNKDNIPAGTHVDTYESMNGHVYVKFDDFTFYPKYAMYYNRPSRTTSKFNVRRRYYR